MLLWDSLFVALVIAPLLTGGAWWRGPNFHVEYTEPAIVAALLLFWLWRRGQADRSAVVRAGKRLWIVWVTGVGERPLFFLTAAWATASASAFATSALRHHAFGSGLADLGIFTNAIANVGRLGYPMSSLKDGLSLLADHQIFLLYPLGWIFPLWPSPYFLLLLQAMAFTTGGIALYWLGRQRLGRGHPVVPWLPFAFWLAGPLRAALRFDVHPEILMLPLFLFAAFFLQEKSWPRRALGIAFFLVALAAKESAGPVACGLGLAWLCGAGPESTRGFTRTFGAFAIAAGAAAFAFDSRMVPGLFGVAYAYSNLYAPLPSSAVGMALAPFTQTKEFFLRLATGSRLKFVLGTLLPAGFVSACSPLSALAALPGFLMLLLTAGEHRISLGYHYAVEPMVGLLFALPAALATPFARRHAGALLPLMMMGSFISYARSDAFYWRVYRADDHQAWVRTEVLPRIAPDKSVAASYALVPHLATRRWVNQIPYFSEKSRAVDCVLIDSSVNNTPLSDAALSEALAQARAAGFVSELRCGTFQLLRHSSATNCFVETPPACPEP